MKSVPMLNLADNGNVIAEPDIPSCKTVTMKLIVIVLMAHATSFDIATA